MYISSNNGASWTAVNNGLQYFDIYALNVNGSNLYAGTSTYLYVSNDNGNSWNRVLNGLTSGSYSSIVSNGTNIFVAKTI